MKTWEHKMLMYQIIVKFLMHILWEQLNQVSAWHSYNNNFRE